MHIFLVQIGRSSKVLARGLFNMILPNTSSNPTISGIRFLDVTLCHSIEFKPLKYIATLVELPEAFFDVTS